MGNCLKKSALLFSFCLVLSVTSSCHQGERLSMFWWRLLSLWAATSVRILPVLSQREGLCPSYEQTHRKPRSRGAFRHAEVKKIQFYVFPEALRATWHCIWKDTLLKNNIQWKHFTKRFLDTKDYVQSAARLQKQSRTVILSFTLRGWLSELVNRGGPDTFCPLHSAPFCLVLRRNKKTKRRFRRVAGWLSAAQNIKTMDLILTWIHSCRPPRCSVSDSPSPCSPLLWFIVPAFTSCFPFHHLLFLRLTLVLHQSSFQFLFETTHSGLS